MRGSHCKSLRPKRTLQHCLRATYISIIRVHMDQRGRAGVWKVPATMLVICLNSLNPLAEHLVSISFVLHIRCKLCWSANVLSGANLYRCLPRSCLLVCLFVCSVCVFIHSFIHSFIQNSDSQTDGYWMCIIVRSNFGANRYIIL